MSWEHDVLAPTAQGARAPNPASALKYNSSYISSMTRPRFGFAMGGRPVPAYSPLLNEHEKRGGSGTAALTNTRDPSEYPTAPPQSSYHGGIPKIGGSEGGFIGLLVGLVVLILVCCCIVYYLLRTREHGGRARRASRSSSAATPTANTKGLLSFLPFQKRRRQKAGWVQQGDEFEYASDEDLMMPQAREVPKLRDDTGYMGTSGTQQQQQSPAAPGGGGGVDAYSDPFDPDRLPASVHKQQAPLPIVPSLHGSPLTEKVPQESPTTPTFEGGTKFKEQF